MQFIKVKWIHSHSDEPILLYSELDGARYETRKFEVFPNGTKGYANRSEEFGSTNLGTDPVPPIEEIASDEQFVPQEITQQEFDAAWERRDVAELPPKFGAAH
jgi:hypothetical protein